jgi:hypothetical protein
MTGAISFGEGCPDTRQQQPRSKLYASDEEARVLDQLIEHRLLTSDEDDGPSEPWIDLAHEAMIALSGCGPICLAPLGLAPTPR